MMPMALIARLAFGAYIYYALECCRPVENPNWEFATGLANTARPVVVVVSGSAASPSRSSTFCTARPCTCIRWEPRSALSNGRRAGPLGAAATPASRKGGSRQS